MLSQKKQKTGKVDTKFWDERRGKIFTRKGGWVISEGIVYSHGYSMMDDFFGKKSFFQILVLNVTGRMPEREFADWLEAAFLGVSYPDARIWCNQVGNLAGTLRTSPVAAVIAGVLASDSTMYGAGPTITNGDFIIKALDKKKGGMSAEEIVESHPRLRPYSPPQIPGFSRPVARGDERLTAMERVATELGFETGEHLNLSYEIEQVMKEKYNERINVGGYTAAFMSDQGYTAEEQYRLSSLCVNSGVHACYVETMEAPPESFFPLRCEDVDYRGKQPRSVPER